MRSPGRHTLATSETRVLWGDAARLKILFINTLYTPNLIGGIERAVQLLAESLAREGHQIVVASTAPERGVRTATVNGVKVYYVSLKNFYWPFGEKENHRAL
jgi:glycosyltransferase involved in cell wall biosynthesis